MSGLRFDESNMNSTKDFPGSEVEKPLAVAIIAITDEHAAEYGGRRQRNGGGPGGGYARMPAGTYLDLHAVGAGLPVAVPSLAR
jgi:hypothetical protein